MPPNVFCPLSSRLLSFIKQSLKISVDALAAAQVLKQEIRQHCQHHNAQAANTATTTTAPATTSATPATKQFA